MVIILETLESVEDIHCVPGNVIITLETLDSGEDIHCESGHVTIILGTVEFGEDIHCVPGNVTTILNRFWGTLEISVCYCKSLVGWINGDKQIGILDIYRWQVFPCLRKVITDLADCSQIFEFEGIC